MAEVLPATSHGQDGDSFDLLHRWRQHLIVLLSNRTEAYVQVLQQMGDALRLQNQTHASYIWCVF